MLTAHHLLKIMGADGLKKQWAGQIPNFLFWTISSPLKPPVDAFLMGSIPQQYSVYQISSASKPRKMSYFINLFESILEQSVLLERIEMLPTELIDRVIEAGIFSEPLGSHDALHSFQALCQEENNSILIRRIHTVFESHSFQKRVETTWNLCLNFDHTKTCRHNFQETASNDLATETIVNCFKCFEFFLDHGTVRPSSFCQTGQSFYLVATKSKKSDVISRLMSLLEPEDLFKPASVSETSSEHKSILQLSTQNAWWFGDCWKRLRSLPESSLSSLEPNEITNLCRFAHVNLANKLLHRGIDLGAPNPDNSLPNWYALLSQPNPEPMLWWFWNRSLVPPEDLLTHAATRNCINAVRWILHHAQNYEDWRRAALVAAQNLGIESGAMFEMIVQHPPREYRNDCTFAQDLLIKIVEKACDESRLYDSYLSGTRFTACIIDIHGLSREKASLENISGRKIKAVRELHSHTGVIGLKVQARLAGLEIIRDALEAYI